MDGTLLAATQISQISIDRDVKIDHFQLLCIAAVSDGQNAVVGFFICDPELYSAVILTFNNGLIIVLKYLLTSCKATFYSLSHAVWLPIDEMAFILDKHFS